MQAEPVFLKPNVVIEPLIDRWYAWPHLISPATAAMNLWGRHLKIMNSYIQAPHIHAAAVKNAKMLGGPFMDYGRNRVPEIRQLLNDTLEKEAPLLQFAGAVRELDKLLKQHARGYGLEALYAQVPDLLKGYVELVYDLNNNPSFRFFEALLYKSPFYNPAAQSVALWLTNNDQRPFVLSTPRLDEPDALHLPLRFADPVIDALSAMKRTPALLGPIERQLNLTEAEAERFRTFFTHEPPPRYQAYTGDKIRMRYFGHACILLETSEVSILVDPLISYYGYPSEVHHFSDADVPDFVDYLLITHNHQDHVLLETLLPLRHKIGKILVPRSGGGSLQDPSLKLMFQRIGFDNVVEIDDMESIRFKDCTITGIPFLGEHSDLNIQCKSCYHVHIAPFSILFMADSCNIEPSLYRHVQRETGDVDVIFLGMECDGAPLSWLYGPLLTDELARDKDNSRRLAGSNYEKGKALVDVFHPKEVYVYAMGQEPWLEFISSIRYTEESNPIVASNRLIEECRSRDLVAERLYGEKELFYERLAVGSPVLP